MLQNSTPDSSTDRAVSPVIGVILMVAITVILAAVIGAFVLNLGSNVEDNVQAGASVQTNEDSDLVTVTYTSNQKSSTTLSIEYSVSGSAASGLTSTSGSITEVGKTSSTSVNWATGATAGDSATVTATVTAVNGDQRTAILTKQVELTYQP